MPQVAQCLGASNPSSVPNVFQSITVNTGSFIHVFTGVSSATHISHNVADGVNQYVNYTDIYDPSPGSFITGQWVAGPVNAGTYNVVSTFATGPFVGIAVAEITGASRFFGPISNIQTTPGTSTDAITTGLSSTLIGTPAMMIAFCTDDIGSGSCNTGTGFTNVAGGLWSNAGIPATVESIQLSSNSPVAATFTTNVNEDHITMGGFYTAAKPARFYANGQYFANAFVERGTQLSSSIIMKQYANGTAQVTNMHETGGVGTGALPSLGNATGTDFGGSVNTGTGTYPTGITAGDALIMLAVQQDTGATTVTWPSGFTEISISPVVESTSFGICMRAAIKTATGSESGNFTINWSGFKGQCVSVIDLKGVTVSPLDTSVKAATSDPFGTTCTLTGTAIIPTNAGDCILFCGYTGSAGGTTTSTTFTPPAGLAGSFVGLAGGNVGQIIFYAVGVQASAGSHTYSGSVVFGGSGDSRDHLLFTLAFTTIPPSPATINLFANGQIQMNTFSEL